MKNIFACIVFIFSLHQPFETLAMPDRASLSYAERTAILGGKIIGAAAGATILKKIGSRYIDTLLDKPVPNLDFSDLPDLDLDIDLGNMDLDLDLSDEAGSRKKVKEEVERLQKEREKKEAERARKQAFLKEAEETAARQEKKDREEKKDDEGKEEMRLVGKFLIGAIKPGQRVGFLVGAVTGYNVGGYLINRGIAWRHGVRYNTEKTCRLFNVNIGQYKALVLSAEKKNLKEMRKALEGLYQKRFGAAWEKRLTDLLYKYDAYVDYLFKHRKKKLSCDEKDLLRMIEIGAALDAIYGTKKPLIAKSVSTARAIYQRLGFVPRREDDVGQSLEDGDQYRTLILSAEKRNLKEMRKVLDVYYERRFGIDWQKGLTDLLYKYDGYADYLFKHRKKVLSSDEKDLLRMIEIGAEMSAVYDSKKLQPAKSVGRARSIYQLLGFVPQKDKSEK